jgi:hypothetical protein
MPPGCPLLQWYVFCLFNKVFMNWLDRSNRIIEGFTKIGRPANSPLYYKEQMEAAGFINITEKKYKWPSNQWPKDKECKVLGLLTL